MGKKALFLIPLAGALALLAGCIAVHYQYGHVIDLNPNGSGRILVTYRIAPNYEFYVTENSIRAQYQGAPFDVRQVEVEAVGLTTEVSYVLEFNRITDLNGWGDFGEEGGDFKHTFYLAQDGNEHTFRETVTLRLDEEYLPFLDGSFYYSVSVPGEITATNGTVDEDGVKWSYSAADLCNRTREMYVTYETGPPTWLWVVVLAVLCIAVLVFAAAGAVVIVVLLRRKKKAPPAAEPVIDTSLEWPEEAPAEVPVEAPVEVPVAAPPEPRVEPRPEPRRAPPPPPARERPRRKLKPVGCVILIVIAAVLAVVVLVAAFFITDYYGVNPLTAPAAEEPAAPPPEVETKPPAPKVKIKFTVIQVLGGGRTAAGVGKELAGKAESMARVMGSKGPGEVELELSISSGGNVVRAKILRSTYKDAALETKIAYAARGWEFSRARGTTRARLKIVAK